MRALLAVVMMALLTVPALAQASAGRNFNMGRSEKAPEPPKKKPTDDKDYNAALSRMPEGKYDPWRTVRGGQPTTAPGSGAK